MSVTYFGNKKYTTKTFVPTVEYFAISRAASNRLREDFELLSVRTLTQRTSKV